MKAIFVLILFVCSAALYSTMPPAWTEFQKDLGIQAARYQNSPEHQALRQSRDSRTYVVGDTHTFWKWNLAVMPPSWVQTPATCRAVGEHCYIFVANSDWNTHMTQANVDSVLVRLEENTPNNPTQGAIEMDINLFGPIPDELDNDEKLIVFYSALGSFQGSQFDGYFSAYNQVTEAQAQQMNPPGHSNLCEMIYMTCYPLNPVAPVRMSVLAHELEHLIHWGQDADEESWIDEGCAELAMVAYGVPDPITSFPSNPDNDLTAWNQDFADYVKVMLFFTYLKEHYDETGLISAVIADPANGMTSFANQVSIYYPELSAGRILRNWAVANTLDSPQPNAGLYNYEELNLPVFSMTDVNQTPSQTNQTVNPYAADYLSYDLSWRPVTFTIQASSAVYATELVFNADHECIAVIDGGLNNQIVFNPLPDSAHSVVFVLTNPNPAMVTYSYAAGTVGNCDDNTTVAPLAAMSCYPNPFRASVSALHIAFAADGKTAPGQINIYNIKGQHICSLRAVKSADSNILQTNWDGRDKHNAPVSGGIYLVKYQTPAGTLSKTIYLQK